MLLSCPRSEQPYRILLLDISRDIYANQALCVINGFGLPCKGSEGSLGSDGWALGIWLANNLTTDGFLSGDLQAVV